MYKTCYGVLVRGTWALYEKVTEEVVAKLAGVMGMDVKAGKDILRLRYSIGSVRTITGIEFACGHVHVL